MRLEFYPFYLDFKEPAGTSRGVMNRKLSCLLRIYDETNPDIFGIGEAAIFEGLSPEADPRYFDKIIELMTNVRIGRQTDLSHFPSLQFGFEQAIRDFASGGKGLYFDSPFVYGEDSIEINGLIWMGDYQKMAERLASKIEAGFRCIKFKIGAIEWDREMELIRSVRADWPSDKIEIRVDANGAFTPDDVMYRLDLLAKLGVSSIEQPIRAGQPLEMRKICKDSPITIALDEELIGKFSIDEKRSMIESIRPGALVLKPALCGGFSGAEEWIGLATEYGASWWVTSALESNVGLDAIAQWVGVIGHPIAQGLGTGALYTNNFDCPLILDGDLLRYDTNAIPDRRQFMNLDWRKLEL